MAKNRNRNRNRKSRKSRYMYGGALEGAPYGVDTMEPASMQSIEQGMQFNTMTKDYHGGRRRTQRRRRTMRGGMAPLSIFGNDAAGVQRDMAHMRGQDMAFAQAAAYSASPAGQDNPNIPIVNDNMKGGRRRKGRKSHRKSHRKGRKSHRKGRRSMYGGALLEGAPWSPTGSDRLLAGDPALMAEAARLESPTWRGVEAGTYLG
jgi:hypothetical protein